MAPSRTPEPDPSVADGGVESALSRIPTGVFVLTARHEDRRTGLLVRRVQQVCTQPPMVCVAVEKGQAIMPLISESHRFGLCQIGEKDRLLRRKFATTPDAADDPFLGAELADGGPGGVPLLQEALATLTCELTCHMDVEGDHDLFVGVVRAGRARDGGTPVVTMPGEDGQP